MLEEHTLGGAAAHDLTVEVEDGGILPAETCLGADYTPLIRVKGLWAPYLAVIIDDPSASKGGFTHWLLWNVPSTETIPRNIPKSHEVMAPIKGVQGRNSDGKIGYTGPCPPAGEEHTYSIRVYGLDEPLDVHPGSTREALEKAMSGHIVQYGQADFRFGTTADRPK